MDRRRFLRTAAGAAALAGQAGMPLLGLAGRSLGAEGARSPNVVLIMADDFGYECVGANGGTSYETPNLDRLAAGGLRFEHAYCAPLCSPTRVLLMTGRYGFRNYKGWGVFDPDEVTFGHLMRQAGYATCVSGKWQLCRFDRAENADHPGRAGFGRHCVWTWHYKDQRPPAKPSRYWDPWIWEDGRLRAEEYKGRFGPDIHCDYVANFIRGNRDRPFFVYYSPNLVHSPFVETPDSRKATLRGPQGGTPAGKKRSMGGNQENFAAMVAYLDKCVGRVVETLDQLGLRENTLILFTGDNGTPRGIKSRMNGRVIPGGKGSMTDGGTHVPLIANWKGTTPAGRVSTDLVDFSDVFPTLADLSVSALPSDRIIDGRSFLPQLRGKPGRPRGWAYIHHGGANVAGKLRAVRDRRWKLYGDGRLFDVSADPFEKSPVGPGEGGAEARAVRARFEKVLASLKA